MSVRVVKIALSFQTVLYCSVAGLMYCCGQVLTGALKDKRIAMIFQKGTSLKF